MIINMYKCISILGLVVIICCNISHVLVGTYSSNGKSSLVNHKLVLKSDSTFNYTIKGDLLNQTSKGLWKMVDSDRIILNSYDSLKPGIIEVVEKRKLIEGIKIKVTDESNNPLPLAIIILNKDENKLGFNLNKKGEKSIKYIDLNTIQINYLGENYLYNFDKSNFNYVKIKIRLQSYTSFYLQNDIWNVKGNILINSDKLILRK